MPHADSFIFFVRPIPLVIISQTSIHPDGRTYIQRYNVTSYPHIGIIDPRTARLMYKKEGWTQEDPLTAEKFAELAADFCSRNSFDKPPSIPRKSSGENAPVSMSNNTSSAVDRMTEEEQLQAAIRASMNEVCGVKTSANDDDDDNDHNDMDCDEEDDADEVSMDEYEYHDVDDDDVEDVQNMKTDQTETTAIEEVKEATFHDEIVAMDVGDEPNGTDGVARIMIRMPDGKRLVRKFKLENAVKIVYAFVAVSSINIPLLHLRQSY